MSAFFKVLCGFAFDNPLAKWLFGALGIAALVGTFALQQQSVGAQRQAVKQERTDNAAHKKANLAASKSADPAAIGMRDPNAVSK